MKNILVTIILSFTMGVLATIAYFFTFDIKLMAQEGEFFPDTDSVETKLFLENEIISFTEEKDGIPTGKKFAFSIGQLEGMREAIVILLTEHVNQQEKAKASGITIPMKMVEDMSTPNKVRMETTKEYETRRRDILLEWYGQIEREHEILGLLEKGFLEGNWETKEK